MGKSFPIHLPNFTFTEKGLNFFMDNLKNSPLPEIIILSHPLSKKYRRWNRAKTLPNFLDRCNPFSQKNFFPFYIKIIWLHTCTDVHSAVYYRNKKISHEGIRKKIFAVLLKYPG
jgi:hypothetical protein